jgi:hypothetical protein
LEEHSGRLIDYKLFLNSAIKALSQEHFDNETFILEQFWKCQFGDSGSHRQVSIEEFNQAFYRFFNRDAKLLPIEAVEQVLNQCFSYSLRKNRKVISKRAFRKVVRRCFKDIFSMILLPAPSHQPATTTTTSANLLQPSVSTS